ncbi:hypothetical protein CI238_11622 [Colletotrichum incanum]|uniref:Uncharacterized protein n=1 Tax=Colletotrichum incanum TaxID=1573173 RepID=A0A161YDZ1_COLIC|nr:hypothetical protein CI238_11622 [Colletotrichum incanum]
MPPIPGDPYFVNPGYDASFQSTVPEHEPNLETVHLIAAEPFPNELKLATSLSKPAAFIIGLTPDKKYWEVAACPGLLTSQDVQGYKLYEETKRDEFIRTAVREVRRVGGRRLASYYNSREPSLKVHMAWAVLLHAFTVGNTLRPQAESQEDSRRRFCMVMTFCVNLLENTNNQVFSHATMVSALSRRVSSNSNASDLHCISLFHMILKNAGGESRNDLVTDLGVPYWTNMLILAREGTHDLANLEPACVGRITALVTEENRVKENNLEIDILRSSHVLPPQELVSNQRSSQF